MNDKLSVIEQEIYGTELFIVHYSHYDKLFSTWSKTETLNLCSVLTELYEWKVYDKVDVKDKVVVDVGSFLGESAIYFRERGARKVICYEPFRSNELIYANCIMNKIYSGIVVYPTALMPYKKPKTSEAKINNESTSIVDETKEDCNTTTLDRIAIGAKDAILKIDIEGAEHVVFASVSNETLRNFSYIMLECHDYYDDITKKLSEAGFNIEEQIVEYTGPPTQTFLVYAKRID